MPWVLHSIKYQYPDCKVVVVGDYPENPFPDQIDIYEKIGSPDVSKVRRHHHHWDPVFIWAKLRAAQIAIENFGPTWVIDSDMYLCGLLPEIKDKPIFSVHDILNPEPNGVFNAGFSGLPTLEIIDRWIELYLGGAEFYEQSCMKDLALEFGYELLSMSHNHGQWRSLDIDRKEVNSFHVHPFDGRGPENEKLIKRVHSIARAQGFNKFPVRRVLHVHQPRTAGTSIRKAVQNMGKVPVFDGWELFNRELTPEEISDKVKNVEGDLYIHNHSFSLNQQVIDDARNNGFRIMCVRRPTLEVLSSLYHYHTSQPGIIYCNEMEDSKSLFPEGDPDSVIQRLVTNPILRKFWMIPKKWEVELVDVKEFEKQLGVTIPNMNKSLTNTGWNNLNLSETTVHIVRNTLSKLKPDYIII